MNIYTGLLFHHGHIVDPALAASLAGDAHAGKDGQVRGEAAPQRPRKRDVPCETFHRGAIAAACCSTALSPFR